MQAIRIGRKSCRQDFHRYLASQPCIACSINLALPGCEASSEIRKILDEKLDEKTLDKMKFAEGAAFERQVLEDLFWAVLTGREFMFNR